MSNPGMWLEIRKGKTNFPLRPISGERFLIGAGSHCHLQLGGDHVPMLHSLLVIDGQTAHLEAVIAEPPLLVNGEARRMVELQDEDIVSIGDFEFVFHRLVASEPVSHASVSGLPGHEEVSGVDDLSHLSALELVNLIEEEAQQISVFNRSRELGAAAMIDAARRSRETPHPISVPMAAYRPEGADVVMDEQLPLPVEQLTEREAACLRRATELMQAQELLAIQMADFARQVSLWQESVDRPSRRARA